MVLLLLCRRGLRCRRPWYLFRSHADAGTYIPVTLEQLASENGVLNSDKTTPCIARTNLFEDDRCVFRIFGKWVDTASFALYVFSISVLLQALVVISMSGAADHGSILRYDANKRKSSKESVAHVCSNGKYSINVIPSSSKCSTFMGWIMCHYRKCIYPLDRSYDRLYSELVSFV
jgi:MFS-type transporter involved in bile tolerance (Atg22 family)